MRCKRLAAMLTLALAPAAATAQDARCSLPGELVSQDANGDAAPPLATFADIQTLHMGEPAGGNALVFTFKMADLAQTPPGTLWAVIFQTDVPPTGGNEYFVAMLTDPTGAAHFVHGTVAPADPSQPALRLFTPVGPLDPASGSNADGTLTLALDKAQAGGLEPGGFVFGMIPITHRITPTDGTMPFAYGIRGLPAAGANLFYDESADGFYEVAGREACGGAKSGVPGAGALNAATLLLLSLGLLIRRRAR